MRNFTKFFFPTSSELQFANNLICNVAVERPDNITSEEWTRLDAVLQKDRSKRPTVAKEAISGGVKKAPAKQEVTAKSDVEKKQEQSQWAETSSDGRYKKSKAGVIFDTKTNLEWFVGPDEDTTWDEAKKWKDSLTVDGGGWRMPSIEELQALYQQGKSSRNMDPVFVTNGWWVWSFETNGSSARYVNFGNGSGYWGGRGTSRGGRACAVRARRS